MTITITHDISKPFSYRIEVEDASGYGLGFGDTYSAAYLQALRDYQPLRNSK